MFIHLDRSNLILIYNFFQWNDSGFTVRYLLIWSQIILKFLLYPSII